MTNEIATNRAHPRSRGEHKRDPRPHQRDRGSSPLTRGARFDRVRGHADEGLIPAHAGSTASQGAKL